jgi:hypothetical protein
MDRSHEQSRDVTPLKMALLITSHVAVNIISNKDNLPKEGFVSDSWFRCGPPWQRHHGGQSLRQLVIVN